MARIWVVWFNSTKLRANIPEILGKIQHVTEKERVKCILEKYFVNFNKTVEQPVNNYFFQGLNEDIMKLRLSPCND